MEETLEALAAPGHGEAKAETFAGPNTDPLSIKRDQYKRFL